MTIKCHNSFCEKKYIHFRFCFRNFKYNPKLAFHTAALFSEGGSQSDALSHTAEARGTLHRLHVLYSSFH